MQSAWEFIFCAHTWATCRSRRLHVIRCERYSQLAQRGDRSIQHTDPERGQKWEPSIQEGHYHRHLDGSLSEQSAEPSPVGRGRCEVRAGYAQGTNAWQYQRRCRRCRWALCNICATEANFMSITIVIRKAMQSIKVMMAVWDLLRGSADDAWNLNKYPWRSPSLKRPWVPPATSRSSRSFAACPTSASSLSATPWETPTSLGMSV